MPNPSTFSQLTCQPQDVRDREPARRAGGRYLSVISRPCTYSRYARWMVGHGHRGTARPRRGSPHRAVRRPWREQRRNL